MAIETRVRDLVATALPVVQAGKHIHLDKPAGPELAPFRKLLATAETNKLCVQMGYMLRYNPAFEFMFRAVREGWFGEIMELDAMMGKQANAFMAYGPMMAFEHAWSHELVGLAHGSVGVVPHNMKTASNKNQYTDQVHVKWNRTGRVWN